MIAGSSYQRIPSQSETGPDVVSVRTRVLRRVIQGFRQKAFDELLKEMPNLKEAYYRDQRAIRQIQMQGLQSIMPIQLEAMNN